MKKIYKSFFTFFAILFAAGSINATNTPSITIIGFDNNGSITQTAPGSNSTVNITFTDATVQTIVSTPSFTIDDQALSAGFQYLQIAKGGTITITRPATTNNVLENIVLWCSSVTNSTDLQPEWSTFATPATFTDEFYGITSITNLTNLGDKAYQYFPLVNGYGDNNFTDFVSAFNEGMIETDPNDIKSFRFTVTNTTNDPLNLYGIYIYTTLTSTGIDEDQIDKTEISSEYYDLTGKVVSYNTKGFIIKRTVYDDGSIASQKTYNR